MKTIRIPQATKQGWIECCEGGVFDANYPNSKNRRGRVQEGGNVTPALTANYGNLVLIEEIMEKETPTRPRPKGKGWVWDSTQGKWFRVRKLTPRECFRLMGVCEADIDKLMAVEVDKKGNIVQVISNSQLYKCAGNSIVVDVMTYMFKNLFFPGERTYTEGEQLSLF